MITWLCYLGYGKAYSFHGWGLQSRINNRCYWASRNKWEKMVASELSFYGVSGVERGQEWEAIASSSISNTEVQPLNLQTTLRIQQMPHDTKTTNLRWIGITEKSGYKNYYMENCVQAKYTTTPATKLTEMTSSWERNKDLSLATSWLSHGKAHTN